MTRVRTTLPAPQNGLTLQRMVGAVIYVRVSTKEQTENLSLRRHSFERVNSTASAKVTRYWNASRKKAKARRPPTGPNSRSC